ncbi:dipeptide ABC transporter ATP-binding protein [Virgifigura deserti]|uniref:dipeptide ABC transporter ATP-binding protein n=1 Tax=Virgifigura deserti TaxID=2268457 RepID=UPI003CCB82ED
MTEQPPPAPLLSVEDLTVDFGAPHVAVKAVRGVSFAVNVGEIVGIVGESGSGKSVTCRAVLGLLPWMARVGGRVSFDGRDLLQLSEAEMRRVRGRHISMIFQNPSSHLDPLMTIGRHVAEPLRMHFGYGAARARDAAIQMLRDVRIRDPELRVDSHPHELSGGMKQRAMIASAIACEPRLLLADEPTTALDVTVQARILELLKDLNRQRGLSIVLISHDLGVIAEICDRVVVMRNGVVVEQGPTREIINVPSHAYTRLLIDSQPSRLSQQHGKTARPAAVATTSEPLLAVDDLSVEFASARGLLGLLRGSEKASVKAVDAVSFDVRRGESFGIVGESGSGKSTIARAITRLIDPSGGRITFRGASVHDLKGETLSAYRRAVQMVFQSPYDALNPRMTVEETIAEPMIRHRLADRSGARKRTAALMAMVELPAELAGRRPRQLSGGQCQRVSIARALALSPEVLIADEITSALDVTIQAQILSLLRRLRETQGLTTLYISHDLAVVRMFCDRVAVFRSGQLVEIGAVEEVLARPRHDYTRRLIASAPRLEAATASEEGARDMDTGSAWKGSHG